MVILISTAIVAITAVGIYSIYAHNDIIRALNALNRERKSPAEEIRQKIKNIYS